MHGSILILQLSIHTFFYIYVVIKIIENADVYKKSSWLPFSFAANLSVLTPRGIGSWNSIGGRGARWHIFKPKIQIWVNFVGPGNGICWDILWTFGLFYSHLIYFMDIWYILW
jgi:hypothetical protein